MLPFDLYKCMCVRTIKGTSCLHQAVSRLSIAASCSQEKFIRWKNIICYYWHAF